MFHAAYPTPRATSSPDCHHVPTAPGQTMCRCQDHRMFLELLIRLQADHITQLEHRAGTHAWHVVEVGS